jgi:hypothetical protein
METQLETTLTRRSWLQGSALLAMYAWATTDVHGVAPALADFRVDAIIIDAALPEAAKLARGARAQDRVEMLDDDVAELFYMRLSPAWRERGVRGLAGLTRAPALFLLEPLALEYGLRTVGLQCAPSRGAAALANLCYRPGHHPVSADPIQRALLEGDDAPFAWSMAPLHLPLRAGIRVILT